MLHAKNILIVVAHADDEVLGCGGTIRKFAMQGASVNVMLLSTGVFGRTGAQESENQERIRSIHKTKNILSIDEFLLRDYPDNKFDTLSVSEIAKDIEEVVRQKQPQLVITHHSGDLNQDHRQVYHATMIACRPIPNAPVQALWSCEIPSASGWQATDDKPFIPDVFIDITEHMNAKKEALEAYAQEMRDFPHARSYEGCEALARWRGSSVGLGAAEAFVTNRLILR